MYPNSIAENQKAFNNNSGKSKIQQSAQSCKIIHYAGSISVYDSTRYLFYVAPLGDLVPNSILQLAIEMLE